jgi:hypothetical protein
MEYQIKPPGRVCAASGQPLVPGSSCHSVVLERDGQLVRLDYAAEHWAGPPEGAVGHWTTHVPTPKHAGQQPVAPETLMRYFEQLCEQADPEQDETRYVAALLLLKLKRLRLNDVRQTDDDAWLLLEGAHGEGQYEVRNLSLSDEDVARRQQTLKAHLATEWT